MAQPAQSLIGLRGALGAAVWLAPRLSARLFGLDPAGNPQAPYLGRLFAARDIALAYGLSTTTGSQRSVWLRAGLACDLADALAGVLARRRGELPKFATVLVTGTALGAAGLSVAALMSDEPSV